MGRKTTEDKDNRRLVWLAVEEQGGAVAVADIVSVTGLPAVEVTLQLNNLAWEQGGHLQVTNEGSILYNFTPGAVSKRFIDHLSRIGIVARDYFLTAFRFIFGLLLVISLTITNSVTAIALTVMGAMGGMRPAPVCGFNLFSLLIAIVNSYGRKKERTQTLSGTERLLELCFRFVFGPPDPNADVENFHWKLVAKKIAGCDGIVCEEELLPFLINTRNPDSELLEAIVRFDGLPECTESGNVVYRFPALQGGAGNSQDEELARQVAHPGAFLREGKWAFSKCSAAETLPVIGLVYGNLAFCSLFYCLVQFLPWFGSLHTILCTITMLWGYSMLIAVFPFCRLAINQVRNFRVHRRNAKRAALGQAVSKPVSAELAAKLKEVAQLRKEVKPQQIIFDTQRPFLEQADYDWHPDHGFVV